MVKSLNRICPPGKLYNLFTRTQQASFPIMALYENMKSIKLLLTSAFWKASFPK